MRFAGEVPSVTRMLADAAPEPPRAVAEAVPVRTAALNAAVARRMLAAGESERDLDDAAKLFRIVGMSTAEEAIELLDRTYPDRLLFPRHRYICYEVASRATDPTVNDDQSLQRVRRIHDAAMPTPGAAAHPSPVEERPPRSIKTSNQHRRRQH